MNKTRPKYKKMRSGQPTRPSTFSFKCITPTLSAYSQTLVSTSDSVGTGSAMTTRIIAPLTVTARSDRVDRVCFRILDPPIQHDSDTFDHPGFNGSWLRYKTLVDIYKTRGVPLGIWVVSSHHRDVLFQLHWVTVVYLSRLPILNMNGPIFRIKNVDNGTEICILVVVISRRPILLDRQSLFRFCMSSFQPHRVSRNFL